MRYCFSKKDTFIHTYIHIYIKIKARLIYNKWFKINIQTLQHRRTTLVHLNAQCISLKVIHRSLNNCKECMQTFQILGVKLELQFQEQGRGGESKIQARRRMKRETQSRGKCKKEKKRKESGQKWSGGTSVSQHLRLCLHASIHPSAYSSIHVVSSAILFIRTCSFIHHHRGHGARGLAPPTSLPHSLALSLSRTHTHTRRHTHNSHLLLHAQ